MKAVVAAFNQEKALLGAFSVITNLRTQFECNFLRHYFRLSLCRESEGFTETQRYNLLQLRLLGERAAPYVPKFTELGFEKARMPGELLEFLQNKIRAAPDPSSWRTETNPARGQINRH